MSCGLAASGTRTFSSSNGWRPGTAQAQRSFSRHGRVLRPSLAAHGETPAAFGRRCIPAPPHGAQSAPWGPRADCVAPPSNIPDILGRHALSAGRLAGLSPRAANGGDGCGASGEDRTSSGCWPLTSPDSLGAGPSNSKRAPARRAVIIGITVVFAGEAGLPGACSRFSDTLLATICVSTGSLGASAARYRISAFGILPRRWEMSARPRTAVRLSGALLRTRSSSACASSSRSSAASARASVTRADT
jgi:hypothetical protein